MSKKLTTNEYLTRANEVHGDKYDYSKVDYVNGAKKIIIGCKVHDHYFEMKPYDHLNGRGCRKCGIVRSANAKRYSNDEFISELKKIHGIKYEYRNVDYVDCHTPVNITCKSHGDFLINPQDILRRSECPVCTKERIREKQMWTLVEFIERANKAHGNKYDYSLVKYSGSHVRVDIICKKHGTVFSQLPSHHVRGVGCPSCSESKGESSISKYLESKGIMYCREYKISECRNKLPLPFDFMFEVNGSIALIEFNGLQHYKSVEYFGGVERFEQIRKCDLIKIKYCKTNKIPLLVIKYNQINKTDKLISEFIESI